MIDVFIKKSCPKPDEFLKEFVKQEEANLSKDEFLYISVIGRTGLYDAKEIERKVIRENSNVRLENMKEKLLRDGWIIEKNGEITLSTKGKAIYAMAENKKPEPSLKHLDKMIYETLDSLDFSLGEIKNLYIEYSRQGLIQGIYDISEYLPKTRQKGCLDNGNLRDIYLRLLDVNRLHYIGQKISYEIMRFSNIQLDYDCR